ncbi:hypothetical protein [Chromobacterium haemolyticum]|uniref:Uncharacterized protein n=1 Tax=Chromobacterium haemolyticum TaxID=394935 RepID=A0A1W0D5G9_9NEIS|nr:hypothetical protein [Chromobacterium haemolyticum]OQS42285.1 hypothetical protein B0T45_05690 [Chromobacterium haemolyticum]
MQQNLIDAARAVIAADRAGELTDELITALEAAADAETAAAGGPVAWFQQLPGEKGLWYEQPLAVTHPEIRAKCTALYAQPVPPDAFALLEIWQTWLGAGRESCSEHDKPLWDRIDAVLASKEPKHD